MTMPLWVHPIFSALVVLLTLLFASSVLRTRRAAGSTLAWLFIICLLPFIGIPLYLSLGGRKNRRAGNDVQPTIPVEELATWNATRRLLAASGVSMARAGNHVEILPTGDYAYGRIFELISAARKSIHLTTFIFANDKVGNAIVNALAIRASEGVEVRILVDSLGATLIRHPSFGSITKAGGKVAYFQPVLHIPLRGRANLRNHRKLLVVDGTRAIVGGMNLAEEYMGPGEDPQRWIDFGLELEGFCAVDLQRIFLRDWSFATSSEMEQVVAVEQSSVQDINGVLAQVVASGPDVSGDPLYDVLLNAIFEAKSRIWIVTPYFIPDETLSKALDVAVRRGLEVLIIIPRASNHRLADLARSSFTRELAATGAKVRLHPKMVHAKALMIDRKMAILGSANFDMRSLLLNYELGLIVYSESTLDKIEKWIANLNAGCDEFDMKSGAWRELGEGIGRVIGPLL